MTGVQTCALPIWDIVDRLQIFETYDVEFHRLALNMDQIEEYGPPPNPAKLSDSRAAGYIEEYGRESWELDALEPQVISDIIREHVTKYRDESAYQAVKRREAREKELLEDVAENWGGLAENWDEIKDTYC